MIWELKDLIDSANTNYVEFNGRWLPSRPYSVSFIDRLKAAWAVFWGHADAVRWPKGQ